jgi:hypothetical protein
MNTARLRAALRMDHHDKHFQTSNSGGTAASDYENRDRPTAKISVSETKDFWIAAI